MALSPITEALAHQPALLMVTILGSLGVFAGIIISSVLFISDAWRKVRQIESDNELKQSMLDRGMSAADIATVIEATSERASSVSINAGRAGFHCEA